MSKGQIVVITIVAFVLVYAPLFWMLVKNKPVRKQVSGGVANQQPQSSPYFLLLFIFLATLIAWIYFTAKALLQGEAFAFTLWLVLGGLFNLLYFGLVLE